MHNLNRKVNQGRKKTGTWQMPPVWPSARHGPLLYVFTSRHIVIRLSYRVCTRLTEMKGLFQGYPGRKWRS